MNTCFYSQPTCCANLSREHVISASVLKAVFGRPLRNIVSGDFLGGKILLDHQPIVRDVCEICNSGSLSAYDEAAVRLIEQLMLSHDPSGVRIPMSREIVCWLIKTHLNYFRVIRDSETNEIYPIDQEIKSALVQNSELPTSRFYLLFEGWTGASYFWDAEDARHIPWFQYRSIRFVTQRIIISDFRLKTLTTWLVVPSDASYDDFEERVISVLEEVRIDLGIVLQLVSVDKTIDRGYIELQRILPLAEVMKFFAPGHPNTSTFDGA
jgi:hypothetical protein